MVPTRNTAEAGVEIKAKTMIQPWRRPQNAGLISSGGAYRAVQRYCAPTVGLMDAISDRESAIARDPNHAMSWPYTRDVGPPFISPAWREADTDSQEAWEVETKAIAGMKLMSLSSFWANSRWGLAGLELLSSLLLKGMFSPCFDPSSLRLNCEKLLFMMKSAGLNTRHCVIRKRYWIFYRYCERLLSCQCTAPEAIIVDSRSSSLYT
jgi:hypothetical protein